MRILLFSFFVCCIQSFARCPKGAVAAASLKDAKFKYLYFGEDKSEIRSPLYKPYYSGEITRRGDEIYICVVGATTLFYDKQSNTPESGVLIYSTTEPYEIIY